MCKLIEKDYGDYLVNVDDSLSDVIEKLCSNKYKGIIVIDAESKPVGTFTRRDMIGCAHCLEKKDLIIRDFMNAKFEYCVEKIDDKCIKSIHAIIPIVDNDGYLKGIFFPDNNKYHIHYEYPVVINAGGKGTRLYPYTVTIPKPLVCVMDDKPMVEMIMDRFHKFELSDFHMIVNYKKNMIEEYFESKNFPYHISFYEEETPLGTGGGLYYLKNKIDTTFLFSNCDIVILENFDEIYEYHKSSGKIATMIVSLKLIHIPYGVIDTDERQNVICSREKPTLLALVNTGIYILEPEIFNYIGKNEQVDFPDVLKRAENDGHEIGVYPITEDRWLDMGQIDELEKAKLKIRELI